jgi:ABC-type Fe3+/spermidine/putrescine transport system ATPase subunit
VGLLGPNGAGKTTTVSMIAGFVTPHGGDVLVNGAALKGDTDPKTRKIGLVPQDLALYEELSARAQVEEPKAHVAPLLNGSVAERAMNRSPVVLIVAVGLVIYGIYAASFIPPLLVGTPAPLLLAGFLVQACAAFLAAFGVWGGAKWAPGAVVLLGVVIAVTELAEAFVLGVIAYDHALIVGLLSILVTFTIAAFLRNPRTIAV